ncbi:MAG: hypothetical protein OJF49_004742 [Ktedonobacterales bacterium]|jgi:hypothetical protein|nr:MAG: hypothetical protein OJF49_004742 [Ktedonobacterales bacterium]
MSDMSANESGEQVGASGGRPPATQVEASAPRWPVAERKHRFPFRAVGLLLATCAAVLAPVVAWMPSVVVTGTDSQQQVYTLRLTPGDIDGAFLGTFGWSALTVFGLLMLPLVWSRRRSLITLLGLLGYVAFAIGLAISGTSLDAHTILPGTTLALNANLNPSTLNVTSTPRFLTPDWLLGFIAVLTLLAALVIGADVALSRTARRGTPTTTEAQPHGQLRAAAKSLLTLAIALWAAGTFLFPWATLNCSATPLLIGHCTGITYSSAASYGILANTTAFDPLAGLHAIEILLGGGAALLLAALWWGRASLAFAYWVTLWLLAANGFTILGISGVYAAVTNPAAFALPTGTWTSATGVATTIIALFVGWVGAVYVWFATVRRGPRRKRTQA